MGGGSNTLLGCKKVTITDPDPVGTVDGATSPTGGQVQVRGWTFDPNSKTSPISVHVYIGGPAGSGGTNMGSRLANKSRPDVGDAYPGVGDNHGFNETFTTSRRGQQQICVHAINVGPGKNKLLGCKTVTIADPPAAPEPPSTPGPQPPADPTPPTGGGADLTAPVVSRVAVTSRFRRARGDTASLAAARRGAAVRFALTEPALARFEFRSESRRVRVIRGGRERCVTSLRRTRRESADDFRGRRRARCSSVYRRTALALSRYGGAGGNAFRFTGRAQGKALRAGRYRLYVSATDAAGNTSGYAHSRIFRVMR